MDSVSVARFEKLSRQLEGLHRELIILSKKAPNDAVNNFKLLFVNEIISRCDELLGDDYRPFTGFSGFADDSLRTNSDVTLMLSQYIECAEQLRSYNIRLDLGQW